MSKLSQYCSRAKWRWHRTLEQIHQQEIDSYPEKDDLDDDLDDEEDLDLFQEVILDGQEYDDFYDCDLDCDDLDYDDLDYDDDNYYIEDYRRWYQGCLLELNQKINSLEQEILRLKSQLYDKFIG